MTNYSLSLCLVMSRLAVLLSASQAVEHLRALSDSDSDVSADDQESNSDEDLLYQLVDEETPVDAAASDDVEPGPGREMRTRSCSQPQRQDSTSCATQNSLL